jgi:hypothetical protein
MCGYAADMGGILCAALVSVLSLTVVVAIAAFMLRRKDVFFFLFP